MSKEEITISALPIINEIVSVITEQKGEDTIALNLSKVSNSFNYFIIATGISKTHIRGIAEELQKTLKEHGLLPHHSEGYNEASWILLDFGEIIIHLFDAKNRKFYQLERLWGDAEEVAL